MLQSGAESYFKVGQCLFQSGTVTSKWANYFRVRHNKGFIEWDKRRYDSWKSLWRKLKKEVDKGEKEIRLKIFMEKKMQREITSGYTNRTLDG